MVEDEIVVPVVSSVDDRHTGPPVVAALALLGLGWSVVPVFEPVADRCSCGQDGCASPGKHPRLRWQRFRVAPPSAHQVVEWWHAHPSANLAVVTGVASGVAVVDVDPRSHGDSTLAGFEATWGPLPETVETSTGGGGRHLWFELSEPLSSDVLGPGLDLKADGGLVVVPPSLHVSGNRYRWVEGAAPWERPLAPLPESITAQAAGRPDTGSGTTEVPPRTSAERAEFAAAWRQAGVEVRPGDHSYLCPFHPDHHPSLHVDADGCRWFCFGCRRGGGIGALRHLLGDESPHPPPRRPSSERGVPITIHGRAEVPVVGEWRHQDDLLDLVGGARTYHGFDHETVARLVPEPDNPHDAKAVKVTIDDRPVGYLRREDARAYAADIDEALDMHRLATCRAKIRGGWDRGRGDVGALGVTLVLPE